ncbi:MAG: DinB family protein [Acidobacteriia bacterium]|nr:DinB family protein [Terriglobia bacterium]
MVNLSALTDLYQHMEWADATVWTSMLKFEGGSADTKLREYLYHLHMVQRAFLRTWRGEPRQAPYPTFDEAQPLMLWARSYYTEVFAHLGALSDQKLTEPMPVPWASMVQRLLGRAPATTTMGETVLQVALHSLYHRGQINARLRAIGGEPPLVDYIVWVWLGRPAANWPQGVGNVPEDRS